MIKLITSELLFNDCPRRASGIEHKEVFINNGLIESVRFVRHAIYTFSGEYVHTPIGYHAIPEKWEEVTFYELTMASGEKFLTMDKLDFIGEFGEL